ncbi:protein-disulfide reductase DsbD domain-containing protein [Cribrihabitans neustonicus]|uniref:protein-disulfide reductase DsbD domain-containing protein n=1 Tax=Cribrihabitans neustonicus TaxID=1429085 RepID=UPI003B5BBA09
MRQKLTPILIRAAAVLAAAWFAVLPASATRAAGLPEGGLVRIEVLDGGMTARGTYQSALKITLAEGWKTYWRAPGEAGIPPSFAWNGSQNVAAAAFTWPAPEVFLTAGMRTLGYHDALVLPVEITPARPGAPVRLKGQVQLGVCKDVCVPAELDFDHTLDPQAGRNPAIAAALASRPLSAREARVSNAACGVRPSRYGLSVTARIAMPPAGGEEVAVIEPGTPHFQAGATSTRREGGTLVAETEFLPADSGTASALDRSRLRITVLGRDHAVDIRGCAAG